MPFHVTAYTTPGGQGRPNEDAHVVGPHPLDPSIWLAVLADGQGGQHGGGAASALACSATLTELQATRPMTLANPTFWCDLLGRTDQTVADDAEAGFTTLVAFAILGEHLIGASNGDSALLVVPPRETAIELTANQRKNPPIGSGGAVVVPFAARLAAGDAVLALSDGVWKFAGMPAIIQAARTLHGPALLADLQQRVRPTPTSPYPDDFTLILIES